MALHKVKHFTELLKESKLLEAEGALEEAAGNYEQVIKQHPLEELAYNRLMVIYRKLKQPKKELRIINKGIEIFMERHDQKLAAFSGNNAIGKLSKALLKAVSGKSRKTIDYPKPVDKWMKRKQALEKKL